MTVSVQVPYTVAVANGLTTIFPYHFKLLSADDLLVTLNGVEQTTGFTVNGIGSETGGNVTFTVAPASGVTVSLERDPVLNRLTDYQQFGELVADVLNSDIDRVWLSLQYLKQLISTALKLPYSTATDQTLDKTPEERANNLLSFDANGNVSITSIDSIPTSVVAGSFTVDTFSGTGADTIFTLSRDPGIIGNTVVFVDGHYIYQDAYSVSGTTLTFDTAPAIGTNNIQVRHSIALTANTPADGSVTTASIAPSGLLSTVLMYIRSGTGAVLRTIYTKLFERLSVQDYGATGNGTTDDAAFCLLADTAGASSGVIYPPGVYFIDTDITLSAPITMMPGARFKVNAGNKLTVNAQVYAGSRQYIFEGASGAIVGTFGRMEVWADWFGAVPDSSIAAVPSGTDSGIGINKALVAIENVVSGVSWIHGIVRLNPGIYLADTGILTNAAGLLHPAVRLQGAGKYKTIITTKTGFTGNVITLSGNDGPPTEVKGIGIASAVGGSLSAKGIKADVNGAFISDVWIIGYDVGVYLNSTDQDLGDFICELCNTGVYIARNSVNVHDGITFGNQGTGVVVKNTLVSEFNKIHVDNVRSISDFSAGFGVEAGRHVIFSDCSASHDAANRYSTAGFYVVGDSADVAFSNCSALLGVQATGTGYYGFKIETVYGPHVQLTDCKAENFNVGAFINVLGGDVGISGGEFINNRLNGIKVDSFNFLSITDTNCYYNSTAVLVAGTAGIRIAAGVASQRCVVNGNMTCNGGAIQQAYGIHISCTNATSYGLLSNNVSSFNITANILVDGANAANITQANNMVS